jgi:DNA-binding NarL/FixJ family response regulator
VAHRRKPPRSRVGRSAFLGMPEVPRELQAYGFVVDGADEYVVFTFRAEGVHGSARVDQGLTSSECAIVELVLKGRSNAEVALERGTSAQTVANQLGVVYRKLGVRSRRELLARDRSEGK